MSTPDTPPSSLSRQLLDVLAKGTRHGRPWACTRSGFGVSSFRDAQTLTAISAGCQVTKQGLPGFRAKDEADRAAAALLVDGDARHDVGVEAPRRDRPAATAAPAAPAPAPRAPAGPRPARPRAPAPRPSPAPPPPRAAGRSRRRLQRVADGVAEVQDGAPPRLRLVLGAPPRPSRAPRARPARAPARATGRGAFFSSSSRMAGIGDEPALDHLGEARGPLARRQRFEKPEVGDHRARLVERADQVLARRADRRRSCRPPRRRPSPATSSGSARTGRRAGRPPRRTRRDRSSRRRRCRRSRRGDRSPGSASHSARLLDLRQALAGLTGAQVEAAARGQPARAPRPAPRARERCARPPSTSTATPVVVGPSAAGQHVGDRLGRAIADPHVVAARPQLDRNDGIAHALSSASARRLEASASTVDPRSRRASVPVGLDLAGARARRTDLRAVAAAPSPPRADRPAVEQRSPRATPRPSHRLLGRHGERNDAARRQHQLQVLLAAGRAAAGRDHRPPPRRRLAHGLGLAPPKARLPLRGEDLRHGLARPSARSGRPDRRTSSPDAPPAACRPSSFPSAMKPIRKIGRGRGRGRRHERPNPTRKSRPIDVGRECRSPAAETSKFFAPCPIGVLLEP